MYCISGDCSAIIHKDKNSSLHTPMLVQCAYQIFGIIYCSLSMLVLLLKGCFNCLSYNGIEMATSRTLQ